MYALYSALLAFFLALTLPYWLLQMLRHGKYRTGLRQRFGAIPPAVAGRSEKPAIWVHAVSVGEVVASSAVVKALQQKFPSHRVMISTTTSTGQKLAARAVRRGERVLFSAGLRLRDPAVPRFFASGTRGRRRNGILAEFSPACQAQRGSHRRDQLPYFRPLAARLQAAPLLASEIAGEGARKRRCFFGPDRRRPAEADRNWSERIEGYSCRQSEVRCGAAAIAGHRCESSRELQPLRSRGRFWCAAARSRTKKALCFRRFAIFWRIIRRP